MWSRAKRESGQRGERVPEEVWDVCRNTEEVVVVAGDKDALEELMEEAIERGYGSDAEAKTKGVRQRKTAT